LLVAVVIGTPTLRLSGHYFSMTTLAVAELLDETRLGSGDR
jgi:ABC-type branched-subunit amino acid transport system permease subunit